MKDAFQDLAQDARCAANHLRQRAGFGPRRAHADVVRSAGMLLFAVSAGAAAWLMCRSGRCQTATPKTDDDYDEIDQAAMDSFPASDPPSFNSRPAN